MTHRSLLALPFIGLLLSTSVLLAADPPPAKPNILWLTTEDIGPHLGCYGDTYAVTPNLDKFAARSIMYLNAWSNAPVCAPARTTIITGVYPTATGSEHMRSMIDMPGFMRMYPQLLRSAGYYCTNNNKEDYNLAKPGKVWDDSSGKAHWKNRPAGAPFMAVFNQLGTHESQIRKRPHKWVHDPANAPLPAYHPDTLESRQDWAEYYDNITDMDGWFGKMLKEVEDAGLADDTIVFFYGDHGSGLPRSKRWPYNSGLQVPLLVHIPAKWKHLAPPELAAGGKTDRLVSFVDLAATLCSLAGIDPPDWMQGRAFLGPRVAKPRDYLFGFRGRMDERTDLVRSIRDKQFVYIKNFMPHRIYGQYLDYMFQTPTTRVWHDLYEQGKLKPPQTYFWETKPSEELYDLNADKWEVKNLASSPEHKATVDRMRAALRDWILQTRDIGFLPEGEIHQVAKESSAYQFAQDPAKFPLDRILDTAWLASDLQEQSVPELAKRMKDPNDGVRYWAATGLLAHGEKAVKANLDLLRAAQNDESAYVWPVAAEALGRYGTDADLAPALETLVSMANLKQNGVYKAMAALQSLDQLGKKAMPLKDRIAALPQKDPATTQRMQEYAPRLLEHINQTLGTPLKAEPAGGAEKQ